MDEPLLGSIDAENKLICEVCIKQHQCKGNCLESKWREEVRERSRTLLSMYKETERSLCL